MSKNWITILTTALLALGSSCNSSEQESAESIETATNAAHVAPETTSPAGVANPFAGKVVETMDSGGYTYVLAESGGQQVWAAGPETALTVGGEVTFNTGAPMVNYHSSTLDRTFPLVYFADALESNVAAPAAHSRPEVTDTPAIEGIEKAEGGVTVEEIFTKPADLVGTEIVLRGSVVKFNANIMGKNWIHVQDGTGAEGTNDLTITTDATVAVGDTVLVRGVLLADRDFGYGYQYDLIIEDAAVTVE